MTSSLIDYKLEVPDDRPNFHWVPEWAKHQATWIAWPHNETTWPGRFENIPAIFEQKIRTLAEVEEVHLLAGPPPTADLCKQLFQDCNRVTVHRIASNDCWIRDYGPTFVLGNEGKKLIGIDWRFNAWGGKYEPYDSDGAAATRICNAIGCERFESKLTCEGGGIETDGEGTLLATSSSVVTASRNPGWTREAIETEWRARLGVEKILWCDGGELAGDDTDSHIDQLVRFTRPGVVVTAISSTSDDSNAPKLELQRRRVMEMSDVRGRYLEVVPLRTPPPRFIQGKRVPESYCNFYIANEIVLVPQFGYRETDDAALRLLQELMPERMMVPLDASNLIWGLGAFHCATQQQPAVVE